MECEILTLAGKCALWFSIVATPTLARRGAAISRYLDDQLTVIVMTNVDETHTDVLKIAGDVAAIYLPETNGANPFKDWRD